MSCEYKILEGKIIEAVHGGPSKLYEGYINLDKLNGLDKEKIVQLKNELKELENNDARRIRIKIDPKGLYEHITDLVNILKENRYSLRDENGNHLESIGNKTFYAIKDKRKR